MQDRPHDICSYAYLSLVTLTLFHFLSDGCVQFRGASFKKKLREQPNPETRIQKVNCLENGPMKDLIGECIMQIPEERPEMTQVLEELKQL